jgi:two-component system, OmpR family, response regulator CpxR
LQKSAFAKLKLQKVSPANLVPGETMKPKRTILCADSNEQALSIRKILLETRGYRVVCCGRADQAMEHVRGGNVDLVIADLALADLDGPKFIDAVKAASPRTPAILLSTRLKFFEYETKADVFLAKNSQSTAELLGHVKTLLVRRRGPKRTVTPPLVPDFHLINTTANA